MTTSFIPEPDPNNPLLPAHNPAVTAPVPTPGATTPANLAPVTPPTATAPTPDQKQHAHDDHDHSDGDDPDKTPNTGESNTENSTGSSDADGTNTDQTGTADDPGTYTTTEPGFPIGELISALIQPPMTAAQQLPQMAMGLPTAALGLAGPLLSSMLALLGHANTPRPNRATPPPPPAQERVTESEGPAIDKYHDKEREVDGAEKKVTEDDKKDADTVDKGAEVNKEIHQRIQLAVARINTAASRTPPSPEGQAHLDAQIQAAVTDARNALVAADNNYRHLAATLTRI